MENDDENMTKEDWFDVFKAVDSSLTWEQFERDWHENIAPMIAENRRRAMH